MWRSFERDGKYNFVDSNNVLVGFDAVEQCCETFGWVVSDAPVYDRITTETRGCRPDALDGYAFDPDWFRADLYGEGGSVMFRLFSRTGPDKFLVLYNHHNGYYSHGFSMVLPGGRTWRAGDI